MFQKLNLHTMKNLLLTLTFFLSLLSNFTFAQGWVTQSSGVGTVSLNSVSFINSSTGLAVGANGTIIKTTNGGANWNIKTSMTTNELTDVQFISATNAIAVGQFGFILMSTNIGETWTTQAFGPNLDAVSFPNSNVGYAVGASGTVLKTTNGGTNWTVLSSGVTSRHFSTSFVSDNDGYITQSSSEAILKTTNGGSSWITRPTGLIQSSPTFVHFISVNTGWVTDALGQIRKTTNGGTNWISQNASSSGIYYIQFKDANTGWTVGSSGRITYTMNGGTNWTTQTSGTTNTLYSVSMVNTTTGWIVGSNGTILKTTTGGHTVPAAPLLTSPTNGSSNISLTPTLSWGTVTGATSYKIQISTVSNFSVITDSATTGAISYVVPSGKLQASSSYFWRVNANNPAGTSAYSFVFNFSTVLNPPAAPQLISPPNGQAGVSATPTLVWQGIADVTSYHIQISTDINFGSIADSATVAGNVTQYTVPQLRLMPSTNYNWRVRARNSSVNGPYSTSWSFFTVLTGVNLISSEVPKEFKLFANYPNPFNPTTKIKFNVPKSEFVSLKIYDNTGKMINALLSANLTAGTYETNWDAKSFASGVYFYKLESATFVDTRRMILVK